MLASDSDSTTAVELLVSVGGPDPITISNAVASDIKCSNANDGTINVTARGEFGNYTFALTGPISKTQTSGLFTGLTQGDYTVFVSDIDGCPSTALTQVLTIENPDPVIVSVDKVTDVSCFGESTGSIFITASGGRPFGLGSGYTYEWTSTNGFASSLKDITNLAAGSYFVSAFDGKPFITHIPIIYNDKSGKGSNVHHERVAFT